LANGAWLPIANLAARGVRLAPLLVQDICGYVVQCRVDNSAVDRVLKSDMVFIRRKFGGALVALNVEPDFEANRVVRATGKAHRRRFNFFCHFFPQGTC
jgi:hypothetical protein